jgi:hypothetical protein
VPDLARLEKLVREAKGEQRGTGPVTAFFLARIGKCQRPRGALGALSSHRSRRNTMSMQAAMQASADALPLALERTGRWRWHRAAARSEHDRCDVAALPYDHGGTIVVASGWLAFYAIAAAYAFGN